MKKLFCEYCGNPLSEGCDCDKEIAEEYAETVDRYYEENRYGLAQQDLIDLHRQER